MIKSLTFLRGIFIIFIFFHHCIGLYPGGGTMAVAFFFVLGGFSMTLGYKDRITSTGFKYRQYLTRRCIKFYPLHWLCILAVMPLALLSFNAQQVPVFFANTTLLHSWIPNKEWYFSFNWVSWYLADTMFFAVLFPFVYKIIAGASLKNKGIMLAIIAVLYILVALMIPKEKYHAILYISPYMRLADFVFGIFLAIGYLKVMNKPTFKLNSSIGQIVVLSLIVLLVIESCMLSEKAGLFALVYWIPVALLIVIAALSEQSGGRQNLLHNKYLVRLGELSFIIFMIHQIVLRYATVIFDKILHYNNIIVYIALTLVLTIVLSLVVERYILNPITTWLTKKIQPSTTARS